VSTPPPLALDLIVFARGLSTLPGVRPALTAIDLDVLPGDIFTIVGRGGSGKTMLLEALVGLRRVAADRLEVCGAEPHLVARAVKQRIGIALAHADVERKITVEEALRLFASFYERADPERSLARLGLEAVRHRPVEALPAALRQRVSLAIALVNDPVVLFADEPARDLDPEGARLVWDLLRERRERGRTSVITTNHLDDAARLSDRVAIIDRGRLVAVDTPAALMARSTAPVRVAFELLKPEVPPDALSALDGVLEVRIDRATYVLTCRDGHATLRAALRLLDSLEVRPLSIGLRQQTLEDVFFELTTGAEAGA
jgi:ABC-2 type transport system ATP-binding protein